VIRTVLRVAAWMAVALLLLWAFASYLEPGFTGEVAGELLRCN
jgi:hypothetical protein